MSTVSKVLASAGPSMSSSSSSSSGGNGLPSAPRMIYEVLRSLPATARPTTTDLYRLVHERYPLPDTVNDDPCTPALGGGLAWPKGLKLKAPKPGQERTAPAAHPIGSKQQLRDGLLNKLRNQHLLQQAFAKTPTKEGAAEVGKGGKKAGAQGQVAGSYYWRFHPALGQPTDRDDPSTISASWEAALSTPSVSLAPRPIRVAETIARWSALPSLPVSADNRIRKPFVPGKFGLPSPVLRKGKPALTEREQIVLELKKYHKLNRQKMRLLPDRILASRRFEKALEEAWAGDNGPERVRQLFAERQERRDARRQRRIGLPLPSEKLASESDESLDLEHSASSAPPSAARANIAAAFERLYAVRSIVHSLSSASPSSDPSELAAAQSELLHIQADVDFLLADLPEAEAAEKRQQTLEHERTFRINGAEEAERRALADRRMALAEERAAEEKRRLA